MSHRSIFSNNIVQTLVRKNVFWKLDNEYFAIRNKAFRLTNEWKIKTKFAFDARNYDYIIIPRDLTVLRRVVVVEREREREAHCALQLTNANEFDRKERH